MLPQDAIIKKAETERVDYFIKQNSHKISQITPYLKHDIKDYIKYLELRIFRYNKQADYEIKDIKLVFDNFKNPYILATFEPIGFILVSLINNEDVLVDMFADTANNKIFSKIFANDNSKASFDLESLSLTEKEIISLENKQKDNQILKNLKTLQIDINETLNDEKLKQEKNMMKKISLLKTRANHQEDDWINYDPNLQLFTAEKELPYAWWFKLSKGKRFFGYQEQATLKTHYLNLRLENQNNPELVKMYDWRIAKCNEFINAGLCHYIGLGMLLLYSEYFVKYGVFSDQQVQKYLYENDDDIGKYLFRKNHFGHPPLVTADFVGDLWLKHGKGAIFTTSLYMKQVAESFIKENRPQGEELPITIHRRSTGWIKPWKWIRDGYPCMVFGLTLPFDVKSIDYKNTKGEDDMQGHAIVVYGTHDNDTKMLCHYGWNGSSQVLLSRNLAGQLWLIGVKRQGKYKTPRKHFTIGKFKCTGWEADLC
ncbi:hypothetical protein JN00_0556 [Metamycoplasma subdolum]|uniref:Uncharacterized protein n=1 Tax=Metamycoplasma subdolum TaxID=92407 RepID=A0A3L9ZYC0_9BACT|nr:hypothetical protein [Metamycoplasma subdolum]RMA77446.1 hypothetical protein JN00_0556 [Metamycoplasma subdolum]WPB50325.1 hypothetical protein R9C05_01815 [Metamycoplasma subdolum]